MLLQCYSFFLVAVLSMFVVCYGQDPQGFPVSMFQFDPKQLGILHTAHDKAGKRSHTKPEQNQLQLHHPVINTTNALNSTNVTNIIHAIQIFNATNLSNATRNSSQYTGNETIITHASKKDFNASHNNQYNYMNPLLPSVVNNHQISNNSAENATSRSYGGTNNPNPRPSNETIALLTPANVTHMNNITNVTQESMTTDSNYKPVNLNGNPEPSADEAIFHLKNPTSEAIPLKDNNNTVNNSTTMLGIHNTTILDIHNTTRANTTGKITNELLFFRNKTTHPDVGTDKTTSLKLTKTVQESPILPAKVVYINGTRPSNDSKLLNAKRLSNSSLSKGNNKTENLSKFNSTGIRNVTIGIKFQNATKANQQNATVNKTQPSAEERRRAEILSHFIPSIETMSSRDHLDSFQLGVKRQQKHDLYPHCYRCAKNSTYEQCVKKSKLHKCNEGLDNICFAKSYRASKDNDGITYEMGCSDHKKCIDAKAFPCRDGSKNCYTCCQFDRCNGSPHHGDFEIDRIDLDELTKEKELPTMSNAMISGIHPIVLCAVIFTIFVLSFQ